MLCSQCKQREAAYTCDCLTAERSLSDLGIQRQRTEQLTGAEEAGLCRRCLRKLCRKGHRGYTLVTMVLGIFTIVSIIAGIICLLSSHDNETLKTAGYILLVGGPAVLVFFDQIIVPYIYAPKHPYIAFPAIGTDLDSSIDREYGKFYIPVGGSYYRNKLEFSLVNRQLSEEFSEKIYNELITTGEWENVLKLRKTMKAVKAQSLGDSEDESESSD